MLQTSSERHLTARRSANNRSRISNGSRLVHADGRSRSARRFRDLIADFASDLGGNLSTAELAVVRQAAAITVRAEELQAAIVRGETIDANEAVRLANASTRLLASLRRRSKQIDGRTQLGRRAQQNHAAGGVAEYLAVRTGFEGSE